MCNCVFDCAKLDSSVEGRSDMVIFHGVGRSGIHRSRRAVAKASRLTSEGGRWNERGETFTETSRLGRWEVSSLHFR